MTDSLVRAFLFIGRIKIYMQHRTQQLIVLLGSDLTTRVLASLRDRPATEAELCAALGVSQPAVNRCVNALATFGLVERGQPAKTGKRGRPKSPWRLASRRRLNALEACLDRCAARLS
jgi:predicted ArsR family transcriptional regulator